MELDKIIDHKNSRKEHWKLRVRIK
jgi:hypothetical protein